MSAEEEAELREAEALFAQHNSPFSNMVTTRRVTIIIGGG